MANDDSVKRAYGEWLALSKPDRQRLGLPTSQAQWAKQWGVDSKTTTRWKEDPLVVATVKRAQAKAAPVDEVEVDTDAEGLERLEQNLMAKALRGDEKAIEQYLKWFGKDELEARRRADQDRITSMTDEELQTEILEMIGVEATRAWLEGQRATV